MIDCRCIDVDFGTYENTVSMKCPFIEKKDGQVCIDTCIASEIGHLWHQGVHTLNSCCGHKKIEPSVIVHEDSVARMLEMGYRHWDLEDVGNPELTFFLDRVV